MGDDIVMDTLRHFDTIFNLTEEQRREVDQVLVPYGWKRTVPEHKVSKISGKKKKVVKISAKERKIAKLQKKIDALRNSN